MILHSNRLVIHPDFTGLGLGIKFVNECAEIIHKSGYEVMAKFSSIPMFKSRIKSPRWKLSDVSTQLGATKKCGLMQRTTGFRENVKTFSFKYIPL